MKTKHLDIWMTILTSAIVIFAALTYFSTERQTKVMEAESLPKIVYSGGNCPRDFDTTSANEDFIINFENYGRITTSIAIMHLGENIDIEEDSPKLNYDDKTGIDNFAIAPADYRKTGTTMKYSLEINDFSKQNASFTIRWSYKRGDEIITSSVSCFYKKINGKFVRS